MEAYQHTPPDRSTGDGPDLVTAIQRLRETSAQLDAALHEARQLNGTLADTT